MGMGMCLKACASSCLGSSKDHTCSWSATSELRRWNREMRRGSRYVPVVWLAPRHTTPVLAQLRGRKLMSVEGGF